MCTVKLSDCTKGLDPQGSVLTKSLSAMIFHFTKDILLLQENPPRCVHHAN